MQTYIQYLMAHHISIRYDTQHTSAWEDVIRTIKQEWPSTEYIIFKEISRITEKLHYHVHLICEKNVNFIRNRFTRSKHYIEYPTKNDKSWYCRLVRDVKVHLLYVTKDGDEVESTMTSEPYKEYIGKWIPKEDFKGDKLQQLIDYIEDHHAEYYNKAKKEWTLKDFADIDQYVIKMLIVEWHVKARKTFSRFVIDNYSNLIFAQRTYKGDFTFDQTLEVYRKLDW